MVDLPLPCWFSGGLYWRLSQTCVAKKYSNQWQSQVPAHRTTLADAQSIPSGFHANLRRSHRCSVINMHKHSCTAFKPTKLIFWLIKTWQSRTKRSLAYIISSYFIPQKQVVFSIDLFFCEPSCCWVPPFQQGQKASPNRSCHLAVERLELPPATKCIGSGLLTLLLVFFDPMWLFFTIKVCFFWCFFVCVLSFFTFFAWSI